MNDTMQHNYGNIDINNGNSMAGPPVSQAAGSVTSSEPISSTSVFNFTDRLPIFSYLVSSNRIRWYRVIMRFFLQCHRELYRYQLTAQEVRDAVRETFDSDYTLEQCQNDLAALKEWGNITTIYDSSRATSIASFLSPALLYQATPEAMAIETFLDEQARCARVIYRTYGSRCKRSTKPCARFRPNLLPHAVAKWLRNGSERLRYGMPWRVRQLNILLI